MGTLDERRAQIRNDIEHRQAARRMVLTSSPQ